MATTQLKTSSVTGALKSLPPLLTPEVTAALNLAFIVSVHVFIHSLLLCARAQYVVVLRTL